MEIFLTYRLTLASLMKAIDPKRYGVVMYVLTCPHIDVLSQACLQVFGSEYIIHRDILNMYRNASLNQLGEMYGRD